MRIVEVEWVDITSFSAWNENGEAENLQPVRIKSVGYLVNKDSENIRIAMSTSDTMGRGVTKVIPLGVVKKIRRIR